MAMTATISATPSTIVTEGDATAIVTVSNSSASPVVLLDAQVYAYPNGASASNINSGVAVGRLNIGPSAQLTVQGSSSLVFTVPLTFHPPQCGALNGTVTGGLTQQLTYKVGATIYSNDGSCFSPTETTITVNNAVTFGSAQQ